VNPDIDFNLADPPNCDDESCLKALQPYWVKSRAAYQLQMKGFNEMFQQQFKVYEQSLNLLKV